jgi:hypothetical protein
MAQTFAARSLFGYCVYLYAMENITKKDHSQCFYKPSYPGSRYDIVGIVLCCVFRDGSIPSTARLIIRDCLFCTRGYVILPYESFTCNQLVRHGGRRHSI